MNLGLEIFATWQTVVLALGIFVTTYVIRTLVQSFWKDWRHNVLYNELVLHLLPVAVALLVAIFAKKFPWPNEALLTSASARCFYACFVGLTCGLFYGRVRAAIGVIGDKAVAAASVVPEPPTADDVVADPPAVVKDAVKDALKVDVKVDIK